MEGLAGDLDPVRRPIETQPLVEMAVVGNLMDRDPQQGMALEAARPVDDAQARRMRVEAHARHEFRDGCVAVDDGVDPLAGLQLRRQAIDRLGLGVLEVEGLILAPLKERFHEPSRRRILGLEETLPAADREVIANVAIMGQIQDRAQEGLEAGEVRRGESPRGIDVDPGPS